MILTERARVPKMIATITPMETMVRDVYLD